MSNPRNDEFYDEEFQVKNKNKMSFIAITKLRHFVDLI